MLVNQRLFSVVFNDDGEIVEAYYTAFQGDAIHQIDGYLHLLLSGGVQYHILYIIFISHTMDT